MSSRAIPRTQFKNWLLFPECKWRIEFSSPCFASDSSIPWPPHSYPQWPGLSCSSAAFFFLFPPPVTATLIENCTGCMMCSEDNGCIACQQRLFLLIWRDGIRQYGACVPACPPGYFGVRGQEVNRCISRRLVRNGASVPWCMRPCHPHPANLSHRHACFRSGCQSCLLPWEWKSSPSGWSRLPDGQF